MPLRLGVDLRTTKDSMRHATVGMTADVYAVTFRSSLHQAIYKLPDLAGISQKQRQKAVETFDGTPGNDSTVLAFSLA